METIEEVFSGYGKVYCGYQFIGDIKYKIIGFTESGEQKTLCQSEIKVREQTIQYRGYTSSNSLDAYKGSLLRLFLQDGGVAEFTMHLIGEIRVLRISLLSKELDPFLNLTE